MIELIIGVVTVVILPLLGWWIKRKLTKPKTPLDVSKNETSAIDRIIATGDSRRASDYVNSRLQTLRDNPRKRGTNKAGEK